MALVVVVSGVAAALLTGRAPNAKILAWAPADSIVYGEFRLDLPGDQRQNLAEFLSHFPGFDDQAAIDTKLDETLDQFLTSATDGDQSYTADIEPWFDGEVGFVASDLPNPGATVRPRIARHRQRRRAPVGQGRRARAGVVRRRGERREPDDRGLRGRHDHRGAGARRARATSRVRLRGDGRRRRASASSAPSRTCSTRRAAARSPSDPAFSAALNSGSGDHVGFVYYDFAAYWDWAMGLAAENDGDVEIGAMPAAAVAETFRDTLPAWGALWTRVEGDALSFQVTSAPPKQRLGATREPGVHPGLPRTRHHDRLRRDPRLRQGHHRHARHV